MSKYKLIQFFFLLKGRFIVPLFGKQALLKKKRHDIPLLLTFSSIDFLKYFLSIFFTQAENYKVQIVFEDENDEENGSTRRL